jgi:hypothetical protein
MGAIKPAFYLQALRRALLIFGPNLDSSQQPNPEMKDPASYCCNPEVAPAKVLQGGGSRIFLTLVKG